MRTSSPQNASGNASSSVVPGGMRNFCSSCCGKLGSGASSSAMGPERAMRMASLIPWTSTARSAPLASVRYPASILGAAVGSGDLSDMEPVLLGCRAVTTKSTPSVFGAKSSSAMYPSSRCLMLPAKSFLSPPLQKSEICKSGGSAEAHAGVRVKSVPSYALEASGPTPLRNIWSMLGRIVRGPSALTALRLPMSCDLCCRGGKRSSIEKWSCILPPTPGSSTCAAMPCAVNCAAGPTPDSSRICGLPIDPALRMTSRVPQISTRFPVAVWTSMPRARGFPPSLSSRTLHTCTSVSTV
eukprot:2545273-Rhodomonas_salina.1